MSADPESTREDQRAAMWDALVLIGQGGCESFTSGHCDGNGRTRGAAYAGEGWCDPCIANYALGFPRDRQGRPGMVLG